MRILFLAGCSALNIGIAVLNLLSGGANPLIIAANFALAAFLGLLTIAAAVMERK